MKLFYKIFRSKPENWKFEGEHKYNFQFRVSMPVQGGYRETGIINVVVPANSKKDAKVKLDRFVKEKIQVTVISVKELNK